MQKLLLLALLASAVTLAAPQQRNSDAGSNENQTELGESSKMGNGAMLTRTDAF